MSSTRATISVAAQQAGVGIETIRYYQRRELIDEPPKPQAGYRVYSPSTIAKIRFIKRAQELGFTLKEIKVMLDLSDEQCAETRELAEMKLELVSSKIKDLRAIEGTLKDLIKHCDQREPDQACPIIYSISDH